jgi:hypothetical protein
VTPTQTFHVQGTVRNYEDAGISGAKVTFEGGRSIQTVVSDKEGFYAIDLPIGLYTMAAQASGQFLEYRRPIFRVVSATSLTFDITLQLARQTCDVVSSVGGPPPNADDALNACGGWDSFPLPSEDHIPFQLSIQFGRRQATGNVSTYDGAWRLNTERERSYVYRSGWNSPSAGNVFVAYNLFTLTADHVVYDVQARTLQAAGTVLLVNADGAVQRADSMRFKIENGDATPLR